MTTPITQERPGTQTPRWTPPPDTSLTWDEDEVDEDDDDDNPPDEESRMTYGVRRLLF